MRVLSSVGPSITLAAAIVLAACAPSGDAAESGGAVAATDAPRVVEITARDYSFEGPDTIPGGLTTLRLANAGPQELHHIQLVRLDGGKTVADLMEAMKAGHPPDWAVMVGGPNAPVPNEKSEVTLDLAPGEYVMLCVIPSPDGVPHVMKGMVKPLTVSAPAAVATAPTPTLTIDLADYSFSLADSVKAGRHTIKVTNVAVQPHEVIFVALAPGKSPMDVVKWVERPDGPPPGKPLGGTTAIVQNGVNYVTIDLAPGQHAMICFIGDAKDGKPHFVHGMIREFTVTN